MPSLFRVAMFDDSFGLAVSDRSIWRTDDGGATWDERQVIASAGVREMVPSLQYSDIAIADARHAWVVGLSGMIWRTDDAGVSWHAQRSGVDLHLNGIAAINADEAWISAAGYGLGGWGVPDVRGTGAMLHTTDGGATWKEQPITTASNGFEFVHFVDKRNGFVVGSTCRWTGGAAADASNFECKDERLLVTVDGGTSWHDNGELFGNSLPLWMEPITASDVALARFHGCPRLSTDAGVNWRWMCGGIDGSMYLSALTLIDSQRGWLLAWNVTNDGKTQSRLFETSDAGANWNLIQESEDWLANGFPMRVSFAATSTDVVLPAGPAGIYLVSRSSNELRPAGLYPLGSREVTARESAAGANRTRYVVMAVVGAVAVAATSFAVLTRRRRRSRS